MNKSFAEVVKGRRTYYSIGKDRVVSEERVKEAVAYALTHAPSAFNSQSARVVVLFGAQHEKLWDIAKAELKKIVPAESFEATAGKLDGAFRSGWGTVLYFEDKDTVEGLQKQFPAYAANFPVWSNQSSGMLQYIIWTALEAEGLGASLQHYNPVIDEAVKAEWGIPANWTLIAQMPFGSRTGEPNEKNFLPLEERMKVFA